MSADVELVEAVIDLIDELDTESRARMVTLERIARDVIHVVRSADFACPCICCMTGGCPDGTVVHPAPTTASLDTHDRWAENCSHRTNGWVSGSHRCAPCSGGDA